MDTFLKEKEELSADYCENPIDPSKSFQTEEEMISFYSKATTETQTFFWNEKNERKDMVGACFTVDSKVVYSITTTADGNNELEMLKRLMDLTRSKKGFVSYNQYPEFEDSADFEEKLKLAHNSGGSAPFVVRT